MTAIHTPIQNSDSGEIHPKHSYSPIREHGLDCLLYTSDAADE